MKLSDFFDLETLQNIQDDFAKATGFAAIIVDYKGNPLLKYSNFSVFCQKIRQNPKYLEYCKRSDAHGSLEAARRGSVRYYKCHAGLIDFAVPIIIDGHYLGSIMCGQIRVKDDPDLHEFFPPTKSIYESEELQKAYKETPLVSYERVVACTKLLSQTLSNIIEIRKLSINPGTNLVEKNLLEERIKELELKYYSSRLNPHFLFNALNMAGRQAYLEKAHKTEEIIYIIADIYRHNLTEAGKLIPLETELSNVKNYMFIQSIRFGELISFKINGEKDFSEYKIPAMTLQNFVENAVIHGVEKKEYLGHIEISFKKEGKFLHIQISDNGAGMDEITLKKLNDPNYEGLNKPGSTGLGILNTKKCLAYFYKTFEVKIQSDSEGTVVDLMLEISE